MKVGRIIGTALLGMFFFLFLAVDLVIFGVLALDSPLVSALAAVGLVLGAVLGAMASRRHTSSREVVATP